MQEDLPIVTKRKDLVGVLTSVVFRITANKGDMYTRVGMRGSWCLGYEELMGLPERGSVEIEDTDAHVIYVARVGLWKEQGILEKIHTDIDEQKTYICLPIEYFNKTVVKK